MKTIIAILALLPMAAIADLIGLDTPFGDVDGDTTLREILMLQPQPDLSVTNDFVRADNGATIRRVIVNPMPGKGIDFMRVLWDTQMVAGNNYKTNFLEYGVYDQYNGQSSPHLHWRSSLEQNAYTNALMTGADLITATNATLTAAKSYANSKYTKPNSGIPKSDLSSSVQNSLTKADSAVSYDGSSYSLLNYNSQISSVYFPCLYIDYVSDWSYYRSLNFGSDGQWMSSLETSVPWPTFYYSGSTDQSWGGSYMPMARKVAAIYEIEDCYPSQVFDNFGMQSGGYSISPNDCSVNLVDLNGILNLTIRLPKRSSEYETVTKDVVIRFNVSGSDCYLDFESSDTVSEYDYMYQMYMEHGVRCNIYTTGGWTPDIMYNKLKLESGYSYIVTLTKIFNGASYPTTTPVEWVASKVQIDYACEASFGGGGVTEEKKEEAPMW